MPPAAALAETVNRQSADGAATLPQSLWNQCDQVTRHRPHNGDGEPDVSSPIQGRTFKHCSADIHERELAQQVATALVVDFGHYRSTHKVIAQKAKASPETVKRWLSGDNIPSFVYIMRLRPHSPALRRLLALESDLSPEFQRELSELMRRHMP